MARPRKLPVGDIEDGTVPQIAASRPKRGFPHVEEDEIVSPPPSDTDEAREPLVAGATWHAGPRDPQLDPVDPIDPVNIANPGGAVSDPSPPQSPQSVAMQEKKPPGISLTFVVVILIAFGVLAGLWLTSVDFDLMSNPAQQNTTQP
jgi:hypothetical protein